MTKKTGAYIIMIAGLVLLITNIYNLDFNDLKKGPFSGIISSLLLILTMLISIRDLNKQNKN